MPGLRAGQDRLILGNPRLSLHEGIYLTPSRPEGQAHGDYLYPKPHLLTFVLRIPGDLKDWWKTTFRRENALGMALIVAGTGILIAEDQWIVDKAQELGDRLHISRTHRQKTLVSLKVPLTEISFQGPHDSGSALYFLGDGWLVFGIAGGYWGYGLARTDHRALQTASQIGESVLASGFVVQALKHVTGRESPFVATRPGGRWKFFPDQVEYHKNVPHYDAFPAGHMAAVAAAWTVMKENYPEYRFLRPLGVVWLGLLGFAMLNNGVHWASDYPLGIALGCAFGRIAVDKGRTRHVTPVLVGNGIGLGVRRRF